MDNMLRRLLPESIFARKLPPDVEQRLRLAQARADEAIVRTHVENALLFVDALAPDVPFERALEVYVREMAVAEPLASVLITRALVALGDGLMPGRGSVARGEALGSSERTSSAHARPAAADHTNVEASAPETSSDLLPTRPRLRLGDASAARRRLA